MTLLRALLLIALGAVVAVSLDRLVIEPEGTRASPPPVAGSRPEPGDPPIVWLDGTLQAVTDEELVLREGRGPEMRVERFAGGATRFLRQDADAWREIGPDEVGGVAEGQSACVETLLDGRRFFAIRVFLGAACGPAIPG